MINLNNPYKENLKSSSQLFLILINQAINQFISMIVNEVNIYIARLLFIDTGLIII